MSALIHIRRIGLLEFLHHKDRLRQRLAARKVRRGTAQADRGRFRMPMLVNPLR